MVIPRAAFLPPLHGIAVILNVIAKTWLPLWGSLLAAGQTERACDVAIRKSLRGGSKRPPYGYAENPSHAVGAPIARPRSSFFIYDGSSRTPTPTKIVY